MINIKKFLLFTQLLNLFLIVIFTRTDYIWYLSITSFILCILAIFKSNDKKFILYSIILLFLSQNSIFIFARSTLFYTEGSDAINDYTTTRYILDNKFFQLGSATYSSRGAYSFYPLLHIFTVAYSYFSLIPLGAIAFYLIPIFNAVYVPIILFKINKNLFNLDDEINYVAIVLFGVNWYYSYFQSNFVRETFGMIFGLAVIWITMEILKRKTSRGSLWVANLVMFYAMMFSHHITSYIIIVIMALIFISSKKYYHNKDFLIFIFIMILSVAIYSFNVPREFLINVSEYTLSSFSSLLTLGGSLGISSEAITKQDPWKQIFILSYYGSIGLLTLATYFRILLKRIPSFVSILVYTFFGGIFGAAVVLRITNSASSWGWAYYMSLRMTIWAFIGLSVLVAVSLNSLLKRNVLKKYSLIIMILLVSVLSIGKLSQYIPYFDDKSIPLSMTDERYQASLWLKDNAVRGSKLLIPPETAPFDAYEGARGMAPFSNLKEDFLNAISYSGFKGYIPFINRFFDIYKSDTSVQQIYSNGRMELGFR